MFQKDLFLIEGLHSLSNFSFLVSETQIIKIKSRLYYIKKEIGIQTLKHSSSIFEMYVLAGK